MSRYKWSLSIADHRVLVVAKKAEVEEAAPNGRGSVQEGPEKIFKRDVLVEDYDDDGELGGIMTAQEVNASGYGVKRVKV